MRVHQIKKCRLSIVAEEAEDECAVGDGQTVGKRGQKQYCEDRERDTERVDHDVLSRAMSRPSTERNECPGDGSFYAASEI